jgi:hypothetical protein
MIAFETNEPNPLPEWMSSSGLGFWEPDLLYVEWMTFLYTIWDKVEYL